MPIPHRVETEMTELERSLNVEIEVLEVRLRLATEANKRLNVEWARQRDEIRLLQNTIRNFSDQDDLEDE